MAIFGGNDDDKRVGFGRRPTPPAHPEHGAPPDRDLSPEEARAEALRQLPADTPEWARAMFAETAEKLATSRRSSTPTWVIAGALSLFAFIFIGVGGWMLAGTLAFTEAALATTGRVAAVTEHRSDDATTWSAMFDYTDAGGTVQRGETHISSSDYNFRIGDEVAILYDPAEPRTVRVDDWLSVWGLPVIFLTVGGGVESVLVLVLLLRARRRGAERAGA